MNCVECKPLKGWRKLCSIKIALTNLLKHLIENFMIKDLHIATSPLTGTIFAGNVLKDGRTWGANKKDVTVEALVAVAEHALKFGKPVEISKADGTPEFRITVECL
ncbi:MAG: hypothetical protein Unbinned3818contig1000_71 [Prokaryotic dsDNA virus sp.]|nr:hypothetical protein [Phycisphaerae bacterium]QDP46000.1 MAG: hypothetical protein Unbinned3818contig1000_71 [Prokaryotic dsDNA virus sp.]